MGVSSNWMQYTQVLVIFFTEDLNFVENPGNGTDYPGYAYDYYDDVYYYYDEEESSEPTSQPKPLRPKN